MIDSLVNSLKEFACRGDLLKAFKTFSDIKHHVSYTTTNDGFGHCLASLIYLCTRSNLLLEGAQVHAHIVSAGLEQHPALVPKLVTFYSNFNFLVSAHRITENSHISHPLSWNVLISSYVGRGFYGEAIAAYKQMMSKGIRPDNFTYPSVLKACGEKLDMAFAREVHKSIKMSTHECNLFVHNSLISMYGKFGEFNVARGLFEGMPERDAVSWNAIITVYASNGLWKEALDLFKRMREENVEPSIITWNTIAGGYLKIGKFKVVLELLSQMRSSGIHLDPVALIIGLSACSHFGTVKLGKEIHGFVLRSYYDGVHNVGNALITMYSRCKDLRSAYVLFQLTKDKSIYTWNSMLSGYTHMDQSEEASWLFREMLILGVEPNYVTIASILPLCARVANLQHGKEFHCYIMRREELMDYLLPWNSLVDMYARSGKVLEARRVFDSLSSRDEVTYTSLIAAYGVQGHGEAAVKLFDEMIEYLIQPDHVTMVAVLSACSHSGLVTKGIRLFETMQRFYGIVPQLEHFACIADLYGRAGLLHKAKETITGMPYRPTPAMWATLLGACCIHGNTEIGEWVAEKLLATRPENPGHYVLIANAYAAAGSWTKLARVRTYMRDFGVKKAPGCSWVDAGSGFVPFVVGDTSKPHAFGLQPLLDGLTELMKDDVSLIGEFSGADDEVL